MNLAQLTVNRNTDIDTPSLLSAVARTVDNFTSFTIMTTTPASTKSYERHHWTIPVLLERILARFAWYHFLTPNDSIDPVPARGRVASTAVKPKLAPGRWDVLIP